MTEWRDRLAQYLGTRLRSATAVSVARAFHLGGGASNETIGLDVQVDCGSWRHTLPLVLRPQRTHGILAPYDVERQFRVLRAVGTTSVPVPPVMWFEADHGVLGAPFFLMGRLDGRALPPLWYGGPSPQVVEVARALALVHRVDWRRAGLGFLLNDLDSPAQPVQADLASWDKKVARAGMTANTSLAALRRYLERAEPGDARLGLLHGDPNPANYLFREGRVVAVLDWELAGLGDPRSDLGFYAALVTVFGGLPGDGRTELSDAYESVTGEPLRDLAFYEAVGLYKMAVIMSGWGWAHGTTDGLGGLERRLDELLGTGWSR